MHGTEYASIAALGRLIQTIDANSVRGTLTLVPVANRLAVESRTMYVCPPDGKNLNRTFPGNPHGSYAEVLADLLWREIASQASHILDVPRRRAGRGAGAFYWRLFPGRRNRSSSHVTAARRGVRHALPGAQ